MSRPPPPAEWVAPEAIWTAWPADAALWEDDLALARAEIAAMVKALIAPGLEGQAGDHVRLLVHGEAARRSALEMIGPDVELIDMAYGDIWLRDTGPVFLNDKQAAGFAFNGWGGKYQLPHDDLVATAIAERAGVTLHQHGFVLEGGAVEGDGAGHVLTTRECLLNPNRNPDWREADAEAALSAALGARKLIWLERGLRNDHTDGHIDNIARFIAPGVIACQSPNGADDPNADILEEIYATLKAATGLDGVPFTVVRLPSPGRVEDADGELVPASHMNFVIGSASVVMPIYGAPEADCVVEACKVLSEYFPTRRIVPLDARHVLTGGGAFHCITQQQPGTMS